VTRWRQRMGEEKLKALLQESLAVATRTDAMKPSDLARVVVTRRCSPRRRFSRPTPSFSIERANGW
jgi:IS5 family transposase